MLLCPLPLCSTYLEELMKRIFLILLLATSLGGCTPVQFANSFVSGSLQVRQDVPYGELERQTLDVYQAAEAAKGVVVFVHGGYWDSGDKSDYIFLADTLTERGFTTIVVNYRLVPEVTFPSYVQDVALALDWVFENLAEGDAANVFLMGHSAGAHIAALVAFDKQYLNEVGLSTDDLSSFVGLAGAYDFLPLEPDDVRSSAALGEGDLTQTQPINFVDGTEPPTFLAIGLDDTTVNPANSERFAERIEQRGGEVALKRYPGVDHAGVMGALARVGRVIEPAILRDVTEFLNSHLRSE